MEHTEERFHDEILDDGQIPVDMVCAILTNQRLGNKLNLAAVKISLMKHILTKRAAVVAMLIIFGAISAQAQNQDKMAKKMAEKVSTAFAYDLKKLDSAHLLNGRLKLTIENSGGDVEFEYKTFRNFAAMERWLKSLVTEPGFPIRSRGDSEPRCRKGLCRLDLIDNQMAHHRVFLTKIYYGYSNGSIYVKKLYVIFG